MLLTLSTLQLPLLQIYIILARISVIHTTFSEKLKGLLFILTNFYLFLCMNSVFIRGKKFELYLSPEQIQARIKELANEINVSYEGKGLLLLPVLNGAFIFAADLLRYLSVKPEIQFLRISSYGDNMESSGTAQFLLGLQTDVNDRHILLVEDIVDTGYTSDFLRKHFMQYQAKSVSMVSLLFKPESLVPELSPPEFVGFEVPNKFLVGYGLDYAQEGRELAGLYSLVDA